MSLTIRTNVTSLVAQRHLANSTKKINTYMQKLSSGHRINKAADDAAGLAIAEGLRSDIRALSQSRRNASDGISLLQVAEGSLVEISNIMVRLKELAVQSASDTIGSKEREYLNMEFFQLKDEIDRIAVSAEFNGKRLLVGVNPELPDELLSEQVLAPLEVQVDKEYIPELDSYEARNPLDIIRLDFTKMNARTNGEESLQIGAVDDEEGTQVSTKQDAQRTIGSLDFAMERLAGYRAKIGSLQNRLESTGRNLEIRIENLTAARSRIMDTDFAEATAQMTQNSILQQAGVSILSQANQLPAMAMQLLQG
ncbi:MAG: flagellin [Oligoflexales bacterium]